MQRLGATNGSPNWSQEFMTNQFKKFVEIVGLAKPEPLVMNRNFFTRDVIIRHKDKILLVMPEQDFDDLSAFEILTKSGIEIDERKKPDRR